MFKKTMLVVAMMTAVSSANAARIEFGKFGGWDTYRIDYNYGPTDNGSLCATRGFFQDGSKVIFSIYNSGEVKFLIEKSDWFLSANSTANVYVQVYSNSGQVIYDRMATAINSSTQNIKQIGFLLDAKFLVSLMQGHGLYANVSNKFILKYNINDQNLNNALKNVIVNCLPTISTQTPNANINSGVNINVGYGSKVIEE